ncbi:MAG: metallophosphoesterase [Bacteroidales bacterium]|nr:metallophosphoesterase [Bacteroidales bacterium]
MKLMFILLPLIYLSGNAYLYWKMLQAVSGVPLWVKVCISIIFWVVAFSMFVSIGLKDAGVPQVVLKILFHVGSVWMAFLLYSVLLLILTDFVRLLVPAIGPGLKYVLPVVVILLVYGYVNYRNPVINNVDIVLDKEFDGEVTAVAISDIHLGLGTGPKALKRYVDMINAQNPDVIFIVGDLIDNSIRPLLSAPFDEILNQLNVPIYMVPGNHEYISGIGDSEVYLESRTSIKLLKDEIIELPSGIQVIGRDDRSNKDRQSLDTLLSRTDISRPIIVLDHQPYNLAEIDASGVDLQISGHTHNGQLWPLNLLVNEMYEQGHGYRKWSHTHIYVSSGLSLWGPPFRIGTKSDLAVLKLSGR